jgi:hypothetical protein
MLKVADLAARFSRVIFVSVRLTGFLASTLLKCTFRESGLGSVQERTRTKLRNLIL